MESRLIPLNAFIGLVSRPSTSWPNPLFDAGYRLVALELPLDADGERVVADAVAFNPGANRFLLVEAKSGRSLRLKQARRYGLTDGQQLIRHTGVTVTRDAALSVSPIYVCLADHVDGIMAGLREAQCAYPILSVSEQAVELYDAAGSPLELADAMSSPVAVNGRPPTIVRVDEESEASEFDAIASQALLAAVSLGESQVSVPDLAGRAIPHLHIYGTRYRNMLIKKLEQALGRHCVASPKNFRLRPQTASRDYAIVEIVESPEGADPRGRTQSYQAIRRRLHGPVSPHQGSLFGSLDETADLGTELEEAASSDPSDARYSREEGEA